MKINESQRDDVRDGDCAPIINEYKFEFAYRRWLASWLGGASFLSSSPLTWYIHTTQIVVLLFPSIIGVVISVLLDQTVGPIVFGGFLLLLVVTTYLTSLKVRLSELPDGFLAGPNLTSDDEEFDFDGFFTADTFRFLFPEKSIPATLIHMLLSFALGAGSVYILHPPTLETLFPGSSVPVMIFCWISVATAYYGLVARHSPDPAQFRVTDMTILQSSLSRSLYIAISFALYFSLSQTESPSALLVGQIVSIFVAALPFLYAVGSIPQIDALLSWLLEQALVYLHGGSHLGSDSRLVFSIIISWICSVIVYALYDGSKTIAIALASVFGALVAHNPIWSRKDWKSLFPPAPKQTPRKRRTSTFSSSTGKNIPVNNLSTPIKPPQPLNPEGRSTPDLMDDILHQTQALHEPSTAPSMGTGYSKQIHHNTPKGSGVIEVQGSPSAVRIPVSNTQLTPELGQQRTLTIALGWASFIVVLSFLLGGLNLFVEVPADTVLTFSTPFAIILLSLWGVIVITGELQHPFLLNVFRNPMFVEKTSAKCRPLGVVRRVCYKIVPLFLIVVLTLNFVHDLGTSVAIMDALLVTRAFRRIWHFPVRASLEVPVVLLLNMNMTQTESDFWIWWMALGFGFQLFFASFTCDRALDFFGKLKFCGLALVTAYTEKKARFRRRGMVVALVVLLFPLTVLLPSLIAAVLCAPLLPLFGLPIFLVGFPRPMRSWPSVSQSFGTGSDAPIYKLLCMSMRKPLAILAANGVLGSMSPGAHFLIRHEKQIVWVQVVERGALHVSVVFKGLELQETSCHHHEGLALDSLFSQSGLDVSEAYQGKCLNESPAHVLRPLCGTRALGYSDSIISMTGIIEQPQNLALMSAAFFRALVWCLSSSLVKTGLPSNELVMCAKSMPSHWASSPVSKLDISKLSGKFPTRFYKYLCKDPSMASNTNNVFDDDGLVDTVGEKSFIDLVVSCYAIVDVLGMAGMSVGPEHIFSVFQGKISSSLELAWLEKDPHLRNIVVKAYRYAFKAIADNAVICPIDSLSELVETFAEYDRDWFMGSSGEEWNSNVELCKPQLYELYKTQDTHEYKSRILSLHEIPVQIGSLSVECIRGLWASLNMELLYFTNDDEERYSIQAHPSLLRNLTVQSAQPPLGYPVYQSGIVPIILPI